jgi:hypothetical protein
MENVKIQKMIALQYGEKIIEYFAGYVKGTKSTGIRLYTVWRDDCENDARVGLYSAFKRTTDLLENPSGTPVSFRPVCVTDGC